MARSIQSGPDHAGASTAAFIRLLAIAIFWIVVAVIFPVQLVPELAPGLAPYAQWMPVVFYALAIWSLVRSARSLQRRVAARPGGSAKPHRKDGGKSDRGLPVIDRKPTVQRMH